MKLKHLILSALVAMSMGTYAQQINPLLKAVLDAYDATLQENPEDFGTYYQRSIEYYQLSDYDKALSDIDNAIKYTPASESDLLAREYSFKADILTEMKRPADALQAINRSLTINPKSYADIYKKGNILMLDGNPQEAYNVYKSLLNLKSRSQEAFFGMAQASADMGNTSEAQELLERAKEVDPTNPLTYCRIGDVYKRLKDYPSATISYLSAITLGSDISRPVEGLLSVAHTNYPAYKSGIDYAEKQSGQSPIINYINASIAEAVGANADAYKSLKKVMAEPDGTNAGTLTQLGQLALATGRIDEAKKAIDDAIYIEATPERYLVRSDIEMAQGMPASALLYASKAYAASNGSLESLLAMAKANIAAGDAGAAIDALNEAALLDATNPEIFLLRSHVNGKMLKNDQIAKNDLKRATLDDSIEFPNVAYRAIAMNLLGNTADADALIDSALASNHSQNDLVAAAIYYAQTGNNEKRDAMINAAKSAGYDNVFVLTTDKTPLVTISGK